MLGAAKLQGILAAGKARFALISPPDDGPERRLAGFSCLGRRMSGILQRQA
jgi:hypothetical protein